MATGTISYHPLSGPVSFSFAMGTADPVALRSEMALAAELITMIKINFPVLAVGQKVAFLFIMTVKADQRVVPLAMVDNDVTMAE